MVHAATGSKKTINHSLVRKMRTLRRWLIPPASYVAPLARHQISPRAQNAHATSVVDTAGIVRRALCATSNPARAQNAHATSVVDTATIVRRAFGATSNIAPCAKCARYVGGWYRQHRKSRIVHDIKYRPVRKMRTLRGGWYRRHRTSRIVRDIKSRPCAKGARYVCG